MTRLGFAANWASIAAMATEIELKLCLYDESDFQRVQQALDNLAHRKGTEVEVQEQTNYYLDTPLLGLRSQRAMLRVRTFGETALLTLKVKPVLAGGVLRAGEFEQSLPVAEIGRWLQAPPPRVLAADLGCEAWLGQGGLVDQPLADESWLHVVGAMSNTRRLYHLEGYQFNGPLGPLKVELDHARFGLGGADGHRYEIELEHPDAETWQVVLDGWLSGLEVNAYPATETKYAQLLRLAAQDRGPLATPL